MFGLKIKPAQALDMLKKFGLDVESLMPKLEKELMAFFVDMETEAGAPLMLVANPNEAKEHFTLSLYRVEAEGQLSLYKSFPFAAITQLINQKETLENVKQIAAEPNAAGGETGTDADPASDGTQPGTDAGTDAE